MKITSAKKVEYEEFETDEGTYRRYTDSRWCAVAMIGGKHHLFRFELNEESTKRLEKLYHEYKDNENNIR